MKWIVENDVGIFTLISLLLCFNLSSFIIFCCILCPSHCLSVSRMTVHTCAVIFSQQWMENFPTSLCLQVRQLSTTFGFWVYRLYVRSIVLNKFFDVENGKSNHISAGCIPQLRQHRKLWACCSVFDWQASLHTITAYSVSANLLSKQWSCAVMPIGFSYHLHRL